MIDNNTTTESTVQRPLPSAFLAATPGAVKVITSRVNA